MQKLGGGRRGSDVLRRVSNEGKATGQGGDRVNKKKQKKQTKRKHKRQILKQGENNYTTNLVNEQISEYVNEWNECSIFLFPVPGQRKTSCLDNPLSSPTTMLWGFSEALTC